MPDAGSPIFGQAASLAAAVCWAVAVSMFRGPIADHGARAVNLAKNVVAGSLLGVSVLALGQVSALLDAAPRHLLLVAASGILGLTIGDTALFSAVGRIGPPRALLLQATMPVFTGLLAFAVQGTRPTLWQLLGGGVILLGVTLVVMPGAGSAGLAAARDRRAIRVGLGLGLLAAFGQAAGIVLAKEAMASLPIVGASCVRMIVGSLGLVLVLALAGRLGPALRVLVSRRGMARLVPPSLLGTYLAFLLMMAGIAWAPAAIAAVLLATVPVWSLLVDAWLARRPIRPRELAGTVIAVAGVALVVSSSG